MEFELSVEDQFKRAFLTGGSTEAWCRCGRTHVAMRAYDCWDDDDDFDHNECQLEYEEKAEKDEMLILHYDEDSISMIELGGCIWVADCECEQWRPYMEFLVHQRNDIAHFLIDVQLEIKRLQKYEDTMDILKGEYKIHGEWISNT